MGNPLINGKVYDWGSIEIMLPGGVVDGITEISYSDEREIEPTYGKGYTPRSYGRGNYKASGSLSIDKDAMDLLRLGMGGTIYNDKMPLEIVITYANDGSSTAVDILSKCMFTKQDTSGKQGDKAISVKLDFTLLKPIKWNGVPAYK